MTSPDFDSDEAMELVLRRARAGLAPNAARRGATLGRLSATLSAAEHDPAPHADPNGPVNHGAQSLSGLAGGKVAAIALAVGLIGGGGVGFGSGFWMRSRGSATPSSEAPSVEVTQIKVPVLETTALPEAHSTSIDVVRPTLLSRTPTEEANKASASRTTPRGSLDVRRRQTRVSNVPALPSSQLTGYDELSHLRRAQKAIKSGNAALALALMKALDEELPRGALLVERNVTQVLALCELGHTEEASSLAERTLRNENASSVYANRLASSCAHLDLSRPAK